MQGMRYSHFRELSRVSEFLPESSVYTDYKWPVHFSVKQMDLPLIGFDKYACNQSYEMSS